jgi:DeoR/GlpR family transcriptional regulator of sugar metabolism
VKYLEESGLVEKTYGGVVSKKSRVETVFDIRMRTNTAEKQAIARSAARLVEDGDSILIDASTTCLALIQELEDKRDLTVFTTAIHPTLLLAHSRHILSYCAGGQLSADTMSFLGPSTLQFLRNIHVDKYFAGAAGIHPVHGITDPLLDEVEVKRQSAQVAKEVIILSDHSKFGRLSHFNVFALDQVDLIVTDAVNPIVEEMQRSGVQLIVSNTASSVR